MSAPGPLDTSPTSRALPEHPLERALPWAMLALTLVPALAGTARLAQIAGRPPVTPENVRFLESPVVRRDLASHRAWMLRVQAIALGAGTQVFTHIPWFLFPSIQTENVRTALMAAGWAINLAVAEHLVHHARRIASDRLSATQGG